MRTNSMLFTQYKRGSLVIGKHFNFRAFDGTLRFVTSGIRKK